METTWKKHSKSIITFLHGNVNPHTQKFVGFYFLLPLQFSQSSEEWKVLSFKVSSYLPRPGDSPDPNMVAL